MVGITHTPPVLAKAVTRAPVDARLGATLCPSVPWVAQAGPVLFLALAVTRAPNTHIVPMPAWTVRRAVSPTSIRVADASTIVTVPVTRAIVRALTLTASHTFPARVADAGVVRLTTHPMISAVTGGHLAFLPHPALLTETFAVPTLSTTTAITDANLECAGITRERVVALTFAVDASSMRRAVVRTHLCATVFSSVALHTRAHTVRTGTVATASVGALTLVTLLSRPTKGTLTITRVFTVSIATAEALIVVFPRVTARQRTIKTHPFLVALTFVCLWVAFAMVTAVVGADLEFTRFSCHALVTPAPLVNAHTHTTAVARARGGVARDTRPPLIAHTRRPFTVTVLTAVQGASGLRAVVSCEPLIACATTTSHVALPTSGAHVWAYGLIAVVAHPR